MADMSSNFFSMAKEIFLQTIDSSLSGKLDSFSNIAGTLGKFGVTIYILWYAYTVLSRKQQSPVPDFIWNLARFTFILSFISNSGGWLDSAFAAVDGLKSTFSHGDPYQWMDQLWGKVRQVASMLMDKDTSRYVKVEGGTAALFTYAGGLLALLLTTIVYLMAEITLKLLTVTAPLFIFCLMFGFLRQMFNNWIQLIFSSLFIFLFGSIAISAGIRFFNGILSKAIAQADTVNLVETGALAFAAGVLMAFIMWQAKVYASQIAAVSAEGAMQGAAAMGLATGAFGASKMAGSLLSGGTNFTKGLGKGLSSGEAGFKASEGALQKTGALFGNGIGTGAAAVRKAAVDAAKKRFGG